MLFVGLSSFCQKKASSSQKEIVISGYISDSTLRESGDKLYLLLYENYNPALSQQPDTVNLVIKNNTFNARLKPKTEIVYFSIRGGKLNLRSIGSAPFVTYLTDSIFFSIKSLSDIEFKGKSSDNLNYQAWASKIIRGDTRDYLRALKDTRGLGIIDYSKWYASKSLRLTIDSLNKMSGGWNNNLREILKLNTISATNIKYLENIMMPLGSRDTLYSKAVHNEIGYMLCQQVGFAERIILNEDESYQYAQYLYRLNRFYFITEDNKLPFKHLLERTGKSKFAMVFNNIKTQYSGLLRDQLFVLIFQEVKMFNSGDALDFLPEAINLTKDDRIKNFLESLKKEKSPGSRAFAFTVEGFDRIPIRLNDFKGKILVIDTYYNGCIPCVLLAEKMEPIIERYKDRNDIVFLNLDVLSKDREKFEDGVNKGIYGSKHSVYAWVGAQRDQHPLIKYYKYYSYPNLLIIGKDGKIISANPEKPFDDTTKNKFIALIEKNL